MVRRFAALVLLGALLTCPHPVSADAVFVGASPAGNSTVGNTVTSVEIVFNEIVTEARIIIAGPDGPIRLDTTVDSGQVISASFPALTVEGRYVVRYAVVSADSDPVDGAFAFTFREGAPAPLPVVAPALAAADDGPNGFLISVGVGGLVLIGLVATQTVMRTRRLRQLTSSKGVPSES